MTSTPPAVESFDELLSSSHHSSNPASSSSSSLTVRPANNINSNPSSPSTTNNRLSPNPSSPQRPIDETRWSGFHLWRQESYDRRQSDQLKRQRELEELQNKNSGFLMKTLKGIRDSTWFASLSRRNAGEDQDRRVSSSSVIDNHSRRRSVNDDDDSIDTIQLRESKDIRPQLSTLKLILLTLSLAGAQVAWTLELAYGTPYLLSLGLSKQSTSLVWLAGPVTGLISQPIIGSLSDSSTSNHGKRRNYMIGSSIFISFSTLILAFSNPISNFLIDLFNIGLGNWDPIRRDYLIFLVQLISIIAFWLLDFSLNALQTVSRALILDSINENQMSNANAWQGKMTSIGNIFGYFVGYINLNQSKYLDWLGNQKGNEESNQFRKFSIISIVSLLMCVSITCLTTKEYQDTRQEQIGINISFREKLKNLLKNLKNTIKYLPNSVKRICFVQFFAFMGWFPFLFYSTTYLIGLREREQSERKRNQPTEFGVEMKGESSKERNEEIASLAMLLYAIVSLVSGFILPRLALASESNFISPSLPVSDSTSTIQNFNHNQETNPDSNSNLTSSSQKPRTFLAKLFPSFNSFESLKSGFTLRSIWTFGSLFYSFLTFLTFFFESSKANIVLISLVGISWSIASWVPFSLIGSFFKEDGPESDFSVYDEDEPTQDQDQDEFVTNPQNQNRRGNGNTEGENKIRNRLNKALKDCGPLTSSSRSNSPSGSSYLSRGNQIVNQDLRNVNNHSNSIENRNGTIGSINLENENLGGNQEGSGESGGAGGILGVHNIAIVLPQFVVAIIASLIFKFTEVSTSQFVSQATEEVARDGTVWVLRFGGLASLLAAFMTRFIPLTKTERIRREELRRRNRGSSVFREEEEEEREV